MTDQKTLDVYNAQFEDYQKMVAAHGRDTMLDTFIDRVAPGGRVLDFGCGPGLAAGVMQECGLQVDAIDGSMEMVRLTNENYDIDARVQLFEDFSALAVYDGIWANFSLLHVSRKEFPKLLESLHRALKPNGVFQIGMKLGTGSERDSIGRKYTYYTEMELEDYLRARDFKTVLSKVGAGRGLAGNTSRWVQILCARP